MNCFPGSLKYSSALSVCLILSENAMPCSSNRVEIRPIDNELRRRSTPRSEGNQTRRQERPLPSEWLDETVDVCMVIEGLC